MYYNWGNMISLSYLNGQVRVNNELDTLGRYIIEPQDDLGNLINNNYDSNLNT